MKVLFVATVRSHIGQFHMHYINYLKSLGHTVDAAFKDNSEDKPNLDLSGVNNIYEIPFSRSPYSFDNIKAYKKLKRLIDKEQYDIIHCHTPMGGVVSRFAAKAARKRGTKVVYTAHGFHFYSGAPRKNWFFYYPVEHYLSKYTDCLITINSEDYKLAKDRFKKAGEVKLVNGVGIDTSLFSFVDNKNKEALRDKYGYSKNDFLIIYPADFSYRKNQYMLFDALTLVINSHKNVRLILPGALNGVEPYKQYCIDNGVSKYVDFLGYRRDIFELDGMCDLSVSSSRQEGLPINLVEAMALGNPIIATNVRGNNDLVKDEFNGFIVELNDSKAMAERICFFIDNPEYISIFGQNGYELSKKYDINLVNKNLYEIYKSL